MPRLVRSLPRYRRHRASHQAVVTLNGRDHYLGPYGTKASKIEYDRLIAEWLSRGRQPVLGEADGLTIVEAILRYWRHAEAYYVINGQPSGELDCVRSALRFVRRLYAETPATEFSPVSLKVVRDAMVEAGLTRGTINKHVSRVRRMFKWLAAEQLVPVAVFQSLTVVDGLRRGRSDARETEPVLPVDDATVEVTLPHLPVVVADMVRVQRLTGMRPGEVCILRPCDIDRSIDPWRYVPESHKTQHRGRERLVFIGPQAQGILLRYLARDAEAYCFRPCDSEAKRRAAAHARRRTPLKYGNAPGRNCRVKPRRQPGDQYDVNVFRRAIHRACDTAFPPAGELAQQSGETVKAWHGRLTDDQRTDLDCWQSDHRWSPNQLRHSAATEIRDATASKRPPRCSATLRPMSLRFTRSAITPWQRTSPGKLGRLQIVCRQSCPEARAARR